MAKFNIVQQKDHLLYEDVLFNHSINPILKPSIVIVGGQIGDLKTLSDCYQAIMLMGRFAEIVVPQKLAKLVQSLPVREVIELTAAGQVRKDSLQTVAEVTNMLILAPGIEETSTNQVALEFLLEYSTSAVICDEMLYLAKIKPSVFKRKDLIFCLSTNGLILLANYLQVGVNIKPDRGIYNKIDIILALHQHLGSPFVIYDNRQILVFESERNIGVTQIEIDNIDRLRGALLGILAGLMARSDGRMTDVFKKAMSVSFIFNRTITQADPWIALKQQMTDWV